MSVYTFPLTCEQVAVALKVRPTHATMCLVPATLKIARIINAYPEEARIGLDRACAEVHTMSDEELELRIRLGRNRVDRSELF